MKMTLIDVLKRQRILATLAETTLADKKLPYELTKAISKNLIKFQEEVKIIEAGRKPIIDTYIVKDEAGNPIIEDGQYKIQEGKMEELNTEFANYMQTETEVEILTVSEDVLRIEDSRLDVLTVAERVALEFIIGE